MKYFVYILCCCDGSYYVGYTYDVDQRLKEHGLGRASKWTTERLPVRLVYSEEHDSEISAMKREQQIKGWNRNKKEKLIKGDWDKVQ